MAFIDKLFPPQISFGATGGPGFSTTIVVLDSGVESANQNWEQERAEYDVAHAARKEAFAKSLLSFFRIVGGRANTFRYKDWLDYKVTSAEGVLTEIDSTHYQMWKRYTFDGITYDRKITKPVNGKTSVTGGTVASIDYATGIVTMTSGTPTSWSGEYHVHARFDTDKAPAKIIDKHADGTFIVGWDGITIVEVKS